MKQSLLSDVVKETADAVYGAQDVSLRQNGQEQARMQLLGAWLRRRTALETPLLVYFDESEAADHWRGRDQLGLRNAVLVYVLLACCDPNRARHVEMLRTYLGTVSEPEEVGLWRALRCGPGEGGCTMHGSYHVSYRWLGNRLLDQRLVLRDQLLAANGRGFSRGWRDFVGDLNPLG